MKKQTSNLVVTSGGVLAEWNSKYNVPASVIIGVFSNKKPEFLREWTQLKSIHFKTI